MHDEQALRARAKELASIYWHHSIRLFPDLLMEGSKTESLLAAERAAILGPLDLGGREVLDIGSWNGYFAFEAKRAGASRVIASDSLCWNIPVFRGRETFDLARECLGLDIEAKVIDPVELPGDLAPVDVVLFLGVFYHMHDPIAVLKASAALAREALVIETHQDLLDLPRPGMAFYPRATLNGDESNWWGPNPECMFELLESIGWPQVYYQAHPVAGAGRGIYHAFRDVDTARRVFRGGPQVHDLRTREGQSAAFAQSSARGVTLTPPTAGLGSWRRWLGRNRA